MRLRKAKWRCPHCRFPAVIRGSELVHELLRKEWLQCSNVACGWTGASDSELAYELSPSAMPNPNVRLPLAPSRMRAALMQSDEEQSDLFVDEDHEEEANDHA